MFSGRVLDDVRCGNVRAPGNRCALDGSACAREQCADRSNVLLAKRSESACALQARVQDEYRERETASGDLERRT